MRETVQPANNVRTQTNGALAPAPMLQRKCACGGTPGPSGECEGCRRKRQGTLQRAAVDSEPVRAVPGIVHDVLRSPGQLLDVNTRSFMEPFFGHDFSRVRIHADARAAESARAVNALAFTAGRDVVFGAGQYAPATPPGRKLLAHELVHVVQQSGLAAAPAAVNRPGDAFEQEADRMAEKVVSGQAAGGLDAGSAPVSIQRQGAQAGAFASESNADRARRLAAIGAIRIAIARLSRGLSGGLLWNFESSSTAGVTVPQVFPARGPESLANRSARLMKLMRDLTQVIVSLESAPIPAGWLAPNASFKKGSLGVSFGTQAWRDAQIFYAHRSAAAGMDMDLVWLNIQYIETAPLPTARVKPVLLRTGTQTGIHIVLPDEAKQPLVWRPLRATESVRRNESIVEVWKDDLGYYYVDRIVEGRKHYLPGFDILKPP